MSNKRYVIYTRGGGRLGNQLINYINLYAFQIENENFDVVNLAFLPYVYDFDRNDLTLSSLSNLGKKSALHKIVKVLWSWNGSGTFLGAPMYKTLDVIRVPLVHKIADCGKRSKSIIGGITNTKYNIPGEKYKKINLSSKKKVEKVLDKRTSVIAGWNVRCWKLVKKRKQKIRKEIYPGRKRTLAAKKYVNKLKSKCDLLVGVHIRQKDYKNFSYYFPSETYKKWTKKIRSLRGISSKKINFLIASDDMQPREMFSGRKYHFATGSQGRSGHYVEDFVELSMCDMVMAPPSTFSVVASFLGDCPLVPLYDGVLSEGFKILENPLIDSLNHEHMGRLVN